MDTPSTDEDDRVRELIQDVVQLMPDALAVVFLIDVSRAGGFEGIVRVCNTLISFLRYIRL